MVSQLYITIYFQLCQRVSTIYFPLLSRRILDFHPLHTPAVSGLVLHARIQRNHVDAGGVKPADIINRYLCHAGYGIGLSAQRGGKRNGVAGFQRVDFPKVIAHSPVVAGDGNVAQPDAGALKMPRALEQGGTVRALIHAHRQADGRDFQSAQAAVAEVHGAGHFGKAHSQPVRARHTDIHGRIA